MVKNKALPDLSLSLSLSLSLPRLADLALSRLVSHVFSLADAVHPEGTPGSCRGRTPAGSTLDVHRQMNG